MLANVDALSFFFVLGVRGARRRHLTQGRSGRTRKHSVLTAPPGENYAGVYYT